MRCLIALTVAMPVLFTPAVAASIRSGDFLSSDDVLHWIDRYREKPELRRVPVAVRALSRYRAFRNPEKAGLYVGFLAGVLGANPDRADWLTARMLALPPDDHWAIVRALAYSGLPDWQARMRRFAPRMPGRTVMIDQYLAGKLPTLAALDMPQDQSAWDRLWANWDLETLFAGKQSDKKVVLHPNPTVIDTLWGLYFATGNYGPILRIVALLPWSKDKDSVDRLTAGSIAKLTLANNAARDPALLHMLKVMAKAAHQSKEMTAILNDVVEAAETAEMPRIRSQALAAIEELKRKGPGSRREISWWGQVGQGALSLGCIAAATLGQVEFGIPCVVGGAVSSAALQWWNSQP